MAGSVPFQLGQLLGAPTADLRAAAWDELIANHTRLLLAVARSFGGGHDEAMDRYSYILEKLRESDFRRLRSFESNRGASFSTWLTLAARRLCLDHHRTLYGRSRGDHDVAAIRRALRRSLVDSLGLESDVDAIEDSHSVGADSLAVLSERNAKLRVALCALSPRERLLLALRFHDCLPASQIAQVLHLPTVFHVYRQLAAVLERLRDSLLSSGVESSQG
jgi:RNA polymerase sigma factor (sigma-70 family)